MSYPVARFCNRHPAITETFNYLATHRCIGQLLVWMIHDLATGYREDYFIVGLTNTSPGTVSPITNGYWLCGQWPDVAPDGATMFVPCASTASPARYVVIIGSYVDHLNICEVEVYAQSTLLC